MQVQDDLKQGVVGAVPIPSDDAGKEDVIAALVANVEAMIRADRKITALKQLQVSKTGLKICDCLWILSFGCSWLVYMQGHIWQTGYENDELEGVVFEDVPEALEKWHALGTKVFYIPPPPFHLFFPFMSLNLGFLFFCHLKFCVLQCFLCSNRTESCHIYVYLNSHQYTCTCDTNMWERTHKCKLSSFFWSI